MSATSFAREKTYAPEPQRRVYGCATLADVLQCDGNGGAYAPPNVQTGMPSFFALSARFAEIPEPGKTMTPIGSTSRI